MMSGKRRRGGEPPDKAATSDSSAPGIKRSCLNRAAAEDPAEACTLHSADVERTPAPQQQGHSETSNRGDFNIVLPTLIQQLKSILDLYQDDGQILKELIQNAEDASARTVKFLLDERTFRSEFLHNPELSKFQGPALYAYNDAVFTDNDWKSLSKWANSVKKDDPTKVGRFGLGFKSVFHMTDLPIIMSGDTVCAIDPLERYFTRDANKRSGYKWLINADANVIREKKDQFEPLRNVFDDNTGPFESAKGFEGTLFRFPLRQTSSEICDNIYNVEKVQTLFTSFQTAAEQMLVFLMSVERIELYVREASAETPTRVFCVKVHKKIVTDLRLKRRKFLDRVKSISLRAADEGYNNNNEDSLTSAMILKKKTRGFQQSDCNASSTYLVSHYCGWASSGEANRALAVSKKLSYPPWASTAAMLLPNSEAAPLDWIVPCPEPRGQLFCFLPLPLQSDSPTGLPVHVNGFFALSSSRHEVKWPSINDSGASDDACQWNKYLLENVVPRAYANMVLTLIQKVEESSSSPGIFDGLEKTTRHVVYSLFPDPDAVVDRWKGMLRPFYSLIFKERVAFVHAKDVPPKWVQPNMTLIPDPDEEWRIREVAARCLAGAGLPDVSGAASVPRHVRKAMQQYLSPTPSDLTPASLRAALGQATRAINMSDDDRLAILEFILKADDHCYQELIGLRLLPLMDGSFTSFEKINSESTRVFIASEEHPQSLLPRSSSLFADLSERITNPLKMMLTAVADSQQTNLCHFNQHYFKTQCRFMVTSEDVAQYHYAKTLWEYLQKHFPQNLSEFEGMPFLLSNKEFQAEGYSSHQLRRDVPVLRAECDDYRLNENTCNALRRMGVEVVSNMESFIWSHEAVRSVYVFPPSPMGILQVLCILKKEGKLVPNSCSHLSANEKTALREELDLLDHRRQYTDQHIDLLKSLPLFEVRGQSGLYMSVAEVNKAAPLLDHPPLPPTCRLLDAKASSEALIILLGIRRIGRAELFEHYIKPAIQQMDCSRDYIDIVMVEVLRNLNAYEQENALFTGQLASLQFVSRQDGKRVVPSQAFDPQDTVLSDILFGQELYPSSPYDQEIIIAALRRLGLRNIRNMTEIQLLECAQCVTKLFGARSSQCIDNIKRKSRGILQFLEDHIDWIGEETVKLLNVCNWLFPLPTPPKGYPSELLWFGKRQEPISPAEIFDIRYATVVGSCSAILPYSVNSPLLEKFKWDRPPPPEAILKHLQNAISVYRLSEKATFLPMVCSAYEILQNFSDSELQQSLSNTTENPEEAVNELRSASKVCYIMVDDAFVQPEKVCLESLKRQCAPYLYQLPLELRKFQTLFKRLGMKDTFTAEHFASALAEMNAEHRDTVLDDQRLTIAINIAHFVFEKLQITERCHFRSPIYLPDSHKILRLASDLSFDNCPWLSKDADEEDLHLLHAMIPYNVACELGVKTTRESTLERHHLGAPFGQKEELVSRIARIMSAYPRSKEIFYELLQNADDSGATEIHFIKDYRTHSSEKVFGDSWKKLQGPSLCVFNNRSFTQRDLQGIQSLGMGSKSKDPFKTGQYGVGFNSVYHLTDVPTFITAGKEIGEVLCVLDPHCRYVPGATEGKPGRQYTGLETLRKKFPDVFSCYLEDLIKLNEGTLFRFPLRTPEMSRNSQLCSSELTVEDLDQLLEKFKNEMFEVLLFVNNLVQIKISEVSRDGLSIQNTFTVQATLSKEDALKRKDFQQYVHQCSEGLKAKKLLLRDIKTQQVCYSVVLKDNTQHKEAWRVVQRIGFKSDYEIHKSVEKAFASDELCLLPRGGVAGFINSASPMCRPDRKRRVYCFLPLPLMTELPVHMNGHFALDYESRRGVWLEDEGGGSRTEWNLALLEEVIAPAYIDFLKDMRDMISADWRNDTRLCQLEKALQTYFQQYPSVPKECINMWSRISVALYKKIHKDQDELLPLLKRNMDRKFVDDLQWLPVITSIRENATFFDDARDTDQEKIKDLLIHAGLHWIYDPLYVGKHFEASGVKVLRLTPEDVINFIRSEDCKHPEPLPCAVERTIFLKESEVVLVTKYCLKNDYAFWSKAEGLPLGLSQANILHAFSSRKPLFSSKYHELLPPIADKFLHEAIREQCGRIPETDSEKVVQDVITARQLYSSKSNVSEKVIIPAILKNFSMGDLAASLHLVLDQRFYSGDRNPVQWDYHNITLPNTTWLSMLWEYIYTQHEASLETASRQSVHQMVECLNQWALLPAVTESNGTANRSFTVRREENVRSHYLVSIQNRKAIVDYTSSTQPKEDTKHVKEALDEVSVMKLDEEVLQMTYKGQYLVKQLITNLKNPMDVLESVDFALRFPTTRNQRKLISKEHCRSLLQYFSTGLPIETCDTVHSIQANLRRLPFYETQKGELIALHNRDFAIIQEVIPENDFDKWSGGSSVLMLKTGGIPYKIAKFLKCHYLDADKIYYEFIFPAFPKLSANGREAHLKYVRDKWLPSVWDSPNDKKRTTLVDRLKELAFLDKGDGILRTAGCFHDPDNELLKALWTPDRFPSAEYNSPNWLAFLRTIGLQTVPVDNDFVDLARKIASQSKSLGMENLKKLTQMLIKHLFESETNNWTLLQNISQIPFICRSDVTTITSTLGVPRDRSSSEPLLIKFNGSVSYEKTNIYCSWSTANFLPDWADPSLDKWQFKNDKSPFRDTYRNFLLRNLGVLTKPSENQIAEHVNYLVRPPLDTPRLEISKLDEVFQVIYTELQKRPYLNMRETFKNMPCILLKDSGENPTFVQASQLVLNMKPQWEVRPYIMKAPQSLARFTALLTSLGAAKESSVELYASLLKKLHEKHSGAMLTPADVTASHQAVFCLIGLMKNAEEISTLHEMYLPSSNGSLYLSNYLVRNDYSAFAERLGSSSFNEPFLVDLNQCRVTAADFDDAIRKIPENKRPRLLFEIVEEHLDEAAPNFGLQAISVPPEPLQTLLQSELFHEGLRRLIWQEHIYRGSRPSDEIWNKLKKALRSIEVRRSQKLVTYLTYKGLRMEKSERKTDGFVSREGTGTDQERYIIYTEGSGPLSMMSYVHVAEIIDKMSEGLLRRSLLYLHPMLQCEPSDIEHLLDKLRITTRGSRRETLLHQSSEKKPPTTD